MKALTGKDSDQGSKSGRQLVRAEASLVDLSRLSSLCRRREEEEEGVWFGRTLALPSEGQRKFCKGFVKKSNLERGTLKNFFSSFPHRVRFSR